MTNREDRETDTRSEQERKKSWAPPTMLPQPIERRGVKFRWIRKAVLGAADPTNMSAKLREGWSPVRAEDHPELHLEASSSGNLEVGGLVLCEMDQELVDQRNRHYQRIANDQLASVDSQLNKLEDRRMPLFKERSSKTTFGSRN